MVDYLVKPVKISDLVKVIRRWGGPGSGGGQATSGYFGGSTLVPLPVPMAGWLLLSGLATLGALGMMRHNYDTTRVAQFA